MLILLMLVASCSAYITFSFLRSQSNMVKKYPFFELRDEIVYSLIENGNDVELSKRYKAIQHIVTDLKKINFNFFVEATAEIIRPLLDADAKRKAKSQYEKLSENTKKIDAKFLKLLMQTGRQNSLLLRFAMTKPGRYVLLAPVFFHLYKKHPNIFERKKPQIKTLQTYAYLAQNEKSYCMA